MEYSKQLMSLVKDLEFRLQRNLDIVNSYKVPKGVYDKVIRNTTFMENEVNKAISSKANELDIENTISKTYIPYADMLYDNIRWYMNQPA